MGWWSNGFAHLPRARVCTAIDITGKEGRFCILLGWEPPSCSLVSHLGTPGHEIRSHIPSTTATSNFPSMKYSAAPQPRSVCSAAGREVFLPPQGLSPTPPLHTPSHPFSDQDFCYPPLVTLLMLCALLRKIRTALPPPPDYPAPTHPSPRPHHLCEIVYQKLSFLPPGSQTCI